MADRVLKNIWEKGKYYKIIAENDDFSHPGFKKAQYYTHGATNILDVGCGDGSKLARLGDQQTQKTGLEISSAAIKIGKKKHPTINFVHFSGDKIPFADSHFDCVTSFFVLEHTQNPQNLVAEMLRVCRSGGHIILLAPNFGAPNRASPNFSGQRLRKLTHGLFADLWESGRTLNWQRVHPGIDSIDQFRSDLDTTIEPYLGSLLKFLQSQKISIIQTSSFWEMEQSRPTIGQRVFRLLGERLGLYPFTLWGPHLFVVGEK